ncbi:MAG TPA: helix-hairpin-helix domain-containing protein [Caldithrix abyssi]|uniref:Helix-hairpin-helix domain-containing protein n=1 Tax=Caldithrix abyssi TaxID=187145 RepID=A0A7V5H229_CALAY|nr:helix-hairpin-helix domain-containing protein [Caldithrix abyssi]
MIVLTKSERRALLLVAFILAISAAIQWSGPGTHAPKVFDYTLQDSLFKVLSADTLQPVAKTSLIQETKTTKKSKKKSKSEILAPHSVDINHADAKTLIKLPRIGPKTAQAIIDYRTEHGPFNSIEELDNVKGIGPKTIEKLRPYIYLTLPDGNAK